MKIAMTHPDDYADLLVERWTHVLLFDAPADCDEPVLVPCSVDDDTTLELIAAVAIRRMPAGCNQCVVGDRGTEGVGGRVLAIVLRDGTVAKVAGRPGDTIIWFYEPGVGVEVRRSNLATAA